MKFTQLNWTNGGGTVSMTVCYSPKQCDIKIANAKKNNKNPTN